MSGYQMSQGLEVLPPKSGKAYPIPCDEWNGIKSKISKISSEPWFFQNAGALLLGASLSCFTTVFTVVFDPATQQQQKTITIAIAVTTLICGLLCYLFSYKQTGLHKQSAKDVVSHMETIERRYEQNAP